MNKILWLAIGTLLPLIGFSQHYRLSGLVLDSASGRPLDQAVIELNPDHLYVLSSSDGKWILPNVTPGFKEIKVTHVGCVSIVFKININSDTTIKLFLQHHVHVFEPHVVHHRHSESSNYADHEKTLQGLNLYSKQHLNLAEQLTSINGVYSLKSGQGISKPVIRGLQGNRIVTIDHGQRLESQQWGSEHAPETDGRAVSSLTVLKGASTLRYGSDAIGGIIILDPGAISDSLRFNILSSVHSNGWGGKVHMISDIPIQAQDKLRIYAGFQRGGDQHTPDYSLTNTAYQQASAGIIQQKSKSQRSVQRNLRFFYSSPGILKASHIGNLTDLQNAINQDEPFIQEPFSYRIANPFQKITHLWAAERQEIAKGPWKLTGQYGFQWNRRLEFDNRRGADKNEPQLNFNLVTHQLDLMVLRKFGIQRLESGIQLSSQSNVQSGIYLIPNYRKRSGGWYGLYRLETEKQLLEAGLRGDFTNINSYFYSSGGTLKENRFFSGLAANVSWRYELNHDWLLMVQASRLWRAPSVNELYSNGLHHGAAALEYGDPELNKEVAHSLSAILVYNHNRFNMEMEPFIRHIDNFISLQPRLPAVPTIRGAFPVFEFEAMDVFFKGLDAQWEWAINNRFFVKGQYSFLIVRADSGSFLNGMPAPTISHEIKYKRQNWGKLTAVQATMEYRYTLRQTYAESVSDYAPPPPAYGFLRASLAFRTGAAKGLWILSVENALNTKYRDYLSRLRYYVHEPAINLAITYVFNH